MDETKIKTGTFKYVNVYGTNDKDSITMTIDGVKYAVPIDEGNSQYAIIKKLSDAGTILIAVVLLITSILLYSLVSVVRERN